MSVIGIISPGETSAASGQGVEFFSSVGAGSGQGSLGDGQVLAEPAAHVRCAVTPASSAGAPFRMRSSLTGSVSARCRSGKGSRQHRKGKMILKVEESKIL